MTTTSIYKIRDANGLFSTGGMNPSFTKKGKAWTNVGHVKSHLHQVSKRESKYKDCSLVEFQLVEVELSTVSMVEFYEETAKQREEQKKLNHQRWLAWEREFRRKQYEQLQQEFGEKK
jgi:hypothetical protein